MVYVLSSHRDKITVSLVEASLSHQLQDRLRLVGVSLNPQPQDHPSQVGVSPSHRLQDLLSLLSLLSHQLRLQAQLHLLLQDPLQV